MCRPSHPPQRLMKPRSSLCSISLRELKAILPLVNFKVSNVKFLKDKLVVSKEAQPGNSNSDPLSASFRDPCWPGALWIGTQPSPVLLELINPGPASGALWLSEGPSEDLPRMEPAEPSLLDGLCDLEYLCISAPTSLSVTIPRTFPQPLTLVTSTHRPIVKCCGRCLLAGTRGICYRVLYSH